MVWMGTVTAWGQGFYRLLGTYYTNWTLLAFLLLYTGYLHPCATLTVYQMLVTSATGGFYIAHIYPRKMVLENIFPIDMTLEGPLLQAGDFLAHQLPLFYFLLETNSTWDQPTFTSQLPYVCVTAFWFLGNDPREQYGVRTLDILVIFAITQLIFFLW